ncbi:transporter substrate-binding domain-containing protein [Mesorhizobium sp. LHD-90]|uniref:transporter substrate-binding domain-containing protein n=1 Tax=Mesorhizobium sp. LHD-90 TaxID=3071414 RepID=UPI0027E1932D|nr:transporter substrate-binding domain-containing protein [Mesorhizobium sp. LHD-90]MDQ6434472.1 transporter substrate-binding domain-containing protein [Mesorhizobium sp. LHD-90]
MKFAFLQEPPFCFTDAAGRVRGCDVELAQVICGHLGLPFEPVEAEFVELLPGLAEGRWTMTTGLFVSDERKKLVDFTRPVWSLPDGLLVASKNPRNLSGYRSLAADEGATLGVIAGQVQGETALANSVPPERIRLFATQVEAAEAVAAGKVDAYASVAMAHRGYLSEHSMAPLFVVGIPDMEQQPAAGAFALAKADAGLRDRIDAILGDLLGSPWHREVMTLHGFTETDIQRVI